MPLALPPPPPPPPPSPSSSSSAAVVRSTSPAATAGMTQDASEAQAGSTGSTFFASLSRTLFFCWAMMLKRPSRLFRPSRVSSIAFLRALAQRDNLSLSPRGLYRLARSYGPWALVLPLIPPIILNTTLTTLLFTTHSGLVALFSHYQPFRPPIPRSVDGAHAHVKPETEERKWWQRNPHAVQHPTLLSAVAGAGAGVVQSTLAIPVEKGVKFAGRVISGSATAKAATASASSPPPAASASKASASSMSPTKSKSLARPGSAKVRKDTVAWLKELRSSGIASSSTGLTDGGWRHISKLGFEGWRWGATKDAVGYAVFFATFDTSRRLALHVRSLVSSLQSTASSSPKVAERPRVRAFFGLEDRAGEDYDEEEGSLGFEGSKWARISQASVLVAGGMLAGQLFVLSTRPFDTVLRLLASPAHLATSSTSSRYLTRAFILSHLRHPLHPAKRNPRFRTAALSASGKPLPAIPLIAKTFKQRGAGYFFRPPKGEGAVGGGTWAGRVGWGLVRMGPWGAGFLAYAWVGGEV